MLPLPGSLWTCSDMMEPPDLFDGDSSDHQATWQQLALPFSTKLKQAKGVWADQSLLSEAGLSSSLLLCEFCDKSFLSSSGLTKHKKRVHFTKRLPYECGICGKGFNQKEHFQGHMNMHNNIKAYKCEKCNREFVYRTSLDQHRRESVCSKTNAAVSSWGFAVGRQPARGVFTLVHILTCIMKIQWIQKCLWESMCDLVSLQWYVNVCVQHENTCHKSMHLLCFLVQIVVDPYVIVLPLPGPQSTDSGGLRQGQAGFISDLGTFFPLPTDLQHHSTLHEDKSHRPSDMRGKRGTAQSDSITVLLCEFCQKAFTSHSGLTRHQNRVHFQNCQPFVCSICHKGFTERGHFEGHMNKHNNVKAYECPSCNKRFLYKTSLDQHVRRGVCTREQDN